MNRDKNQEHTRKAYTPPSITKVGLAVEEAVLAGCKNSGLNGPTLADCKHPTLGACLASLS